MRCPDRARFSPAGRMPPPAFLPGTVFPDTIQVASSTFPVSSVNDLENTARSWYDAGYVSLRRRYSHGLSLLANYTFAKNLSNAPEFRSPMAESAIPQNDNDLAAEKGPACDVRHRFSLSAVYELPALRSADWRRALTRNWRLSTIYQVQSGFPFTISVFGDTANAGAIVGENPIRANYTGQPVFGAGTRTTAEWFNPASFSHSSRVHLRQRGTEYRLRAWHANDGSRAGPLVRAGRTPAHGTSRRGLQRAEPFELGYAEPLRQYAAIRHHHGSFHARPRVPVERKALFLICPSRKRNDRPGDILRHKHHWS